MTSAEQLACITNQMPDVRSCTIRGEHTDVCQADEEHGGHDGWEYRLVTTGYDKQKRRPIHEYVATGKQCKGCVPRAARIGLLCMPCWLNLEQALAAWPRFEQMIRGVDRAVRADGGGRSGRAAGYVPIPGTKLSVEECVSYLNAQAWSDARAWVSTEDGARNAVLFTRAAQIAYRSHPIEEASRKLRRVRCPKCGQLSFVRRPPEAEGQPVVVRCQNEACGKTIREGETTGGEEKLVVIAAIERRRA